MRILPILVAIVFASLLIVPIALRASSAQGPQLQVWLDTATPTNECGYGSFGLNYTEPTTPLPPATTDYDFCSEYASNEGIVLPASAQIQLYGVGGSGEQMNLTFYDVTARLMVFTLTDVPVNFGSGTTCASAGLMTITLPGQYGNLETSYTIADADYQANFTFAQPLGATPPTLCDGSGTPSNILISSTVTIPTPEFPLGVILPVLVPLAGTVTYVLVIPHVRPK